MQKLLGWCAPAARYSALAQLQHRLLRGRPVAARAGDSIVVPGHGQPLGSRLGRPRRAKPRDVLAAERGERRDRAGVARRVALALLDLGRRDDRPRPQLRERRSALPVTSHFGPANARAASIVSGVVPSWLTSTTTIGVAAGASTTRARAPPARRSARHGTTCRSRTTATRALGQPPPGRHLRAATRAARRSPSSSSPRHTALYTIGRHGGLRALQTLDNGLRVLTAPMPHAQSVACFVMLAAGSRYEKQSEPRHRALRRAHVLQGHRAPPDRARLAGESTAIGGEFNAFTGRSTPATTSAAPAPTATRRSTCSSTCSATRSSTRTRSSARRA